MPIVYCGVCPHPPIAVPEVGKKESGRVSKSAEAMEELGRRVKASGAEALVLISPHSPLFADGVAVNETASLTGSLASFGAPEVQFNLINDLELAEKIYQRASRMGIPGITLGPAEARDYGVSLELDHGLMVPLYFLRQAGVDIPVAAVSMAMLSREKLYTYGLAIRQAADDAGKKVALIASADLSHRLTREAPAGYEPRGLEFDRAVVDLVGEADAAGLIGLDPDLCERAGECGLRSIIMMLGALDGLAVESEVLSYEGPFGVGYMVASLTPGSMDENRFFMARLMERQQEIRRQRRTNESYLVQIARQSVESYTRGDWQAPDPADIPPEFAQKAGAFVSLKKDGQLRGCIGTTAPTRENIVQEVAHNAISAAAQDPRFYPVRVDELAELVYSVDVLQPPEPIDGIDQLNPKKYGVIVRQGRRSGLLLPDLEGVDSAAEQVRIAKEKAGIGADEQVALERFEVIRYH